MTYGTCMIYYIFEKIFSKAGNHCSNKLTFFDKAVIFKKKSILVSTHDKRYPNIYFKHIDEFELLSVKLFIDLYLHTMKHLHKN